MKTIKITILAFILLAATTLKIELEVKPLLNNKIELKIPKDFQIMSKEMLEKKYPRNNPPTLVFTNESGGINVGLNHTQSKATQGEIEMYRDALVRTFKSNFPNAKWKDSGIKEINRKNVGYMEVITPAADGKIYNLMFFTNVDGRLLICSFNCMEKNIPEWEPVAKEIMNSLKVK